MKKDATIDLRGSSNEGDDQPEFEVSQIIEETFADSAHEIKAMEESDLDLSAVSTSRMVKIHFDKFVNLLSKYDYEFLINKFYDQDVIISTDLLADLANVPEAEKEPDKKLLYLFFGGLSVGIVLMWLLTKF